MQYPFIILSEMDSMRSLFARIFARVFFRI